MRLIWVDAGIKTALVESMRLSLTFSLSFLGLSLLCLACTPTDSSSEETETAAEALVLLPAPEPEAGTAVLRDNKWISKRDNPAIRGARTLRSDEYVVTGSQGYTLFHFNLFGQVMDAAGNRSVLPAFSGSAVNVEETMKWQSRGMLLPRRITQAANEGILSYTGWYDPADVQIGAYQATEPVNIQLDTNVRLVPVHFIALYAPESSLTAFRLPWSSFDALRVLDDVASVDTDLNTTPTASPDNITYHWQMASGLASPDPVWTQCDIQFRMVNYTACRVPAQLMEAPLNLCSGNAIIARDMPSRAQSMIVLARPRVFSWLSRA